MTGTTAEPGPAGAASDGGGTGGGALEALAAELRRRGVSLDGADPASIARVVDAVSAASRGVSFREYMEVVAETMKGRSAATYRTAWRFTADGWFVDAAALPVVSQLDATLGTGLSDAIRKASVCHRHGQACLVPPRGGWPVAEFDSATLLINAKWVQLRTLVDNHFLSLRRAKRGLPPLPRHGQNAVENFVNAHRLLFRIACGDPKLNMAVNPAEALHLPDREPVVTRRPMTRAERNEVWEVTCTVGDDPELDRLLFLFHLHTGSRQEGAWKLTVGDLDFERQTVTIWLKASKNKPKRRHEVPVPRGLLEHLLALAYRRGSVHRHDPVFRVKATDPATGLGRPLTHRHYETWHRHVQENVEWAGRLGWSSHWLRHTAKADIEDIAGKRAARAFLGHAAADTTDGYGVAPTEHVAWAVQVRTGQPHPLAVKP